PACAGSARPGTETAHPARVATISHSTAHRRRRLPRTPTDTDSRSIPDTVPRRSRPAQHPARQLWISTGPVGNLANHVRACYGCANNATRAAVRVGPGRRGDTAGTDPGPCDEPARRT